MSNLYPANTKITETLLKIKKEKKRKTQSKKEKSTVCETSFFYRWKRKTRLDGRCSKWIETKMKTKLQETNKKQIYLSSSG